MNSRSLTGFLLWQILVLGLLARAGDGGPDPEADQYFELHGDYAASHIIVAYKNADKAKPGIRRSKKEALAKAQELLGRLQSDPASFEALAREESDGPSSVLGGSLGVFRKGDMTPAFEAALRKLEPGQIADSPVKTSFGYHLIRRNPMRAKHYGAYQILIVYDGVEPIRRVTDPSAYQRTEAQARALIEKIQSDLEILPFSQLSAERGDIRGSSGFVGVFKPGDGVITDRMIEVLKSLDYNSVSDVVALPTGLALLRRIKVEQRSGARIWICYQGAKRASDQITRERAAAASLADELAGQLRTDPSLFETLAKENSDGPFAMRGGVLPLWFKGYQEPEIEIAFGQLEPGAISQEPVETASGFYILKKTP